jgi:hypothetical protein
VNDALMQLAKQTNVHLVPKRVLLVSSVVDWTIPVSKIVRLFLVRPVKSVKMALVSLTRVPAKLVLLVKCALLETARKTIVMQAMYVDMAESVKRLSTPVPTTHVLA